MASATRSGLGGERGQILLPALFVIPSLVLVVFLLVETGNLSRAKIRQQFALDAAATVEMELYTDTLNRLAYLNGVFPDRIFREVYGSAYQHYRGAGLYPGSEKVVVENEETWPIRYGGMRAYANNPDPPSNFGVLHMHLPGGGVVTLDHANKVAVGYIQVYQWLGNVAASQKMVFEHTIKDHGMFKKGLYMNLEGEQEKGIDSACPDIESCGDDSAHSFLNLSIRMHYLSGFKHCPVVISIAGDKYMGELAGAFNFTGSGLWQLATVPPHELERLEKGYVVKHHWQPPKNYFQIDFTQSQSNIRKKDTGNVDEYEAQASGGGFGIFFPGSSTGGPYVRARVTASGGRVWPDTTPTYFTKLHP